MIRTFKTWRLPNITKFRIVDWCWNKLLLSLNIKKKERKLSIISSKLNVKNNLLLFHDQKMLVQSIGKVLQKDHMNITAEIKSHWNSETTNDLFFSLAREIMIRNHSFLVKHIHKIDIKFGRTRTISELKYLITKVQEKVIKGSLAISLRRKWIQAPAPKARSLTIPSLVDRIIASMWTEILELYLKGTIGMGHHGYQEGKGTSSALEELLIEQKKYPIIYEFDLKNFFPSVNQNELYKILQNLGIPKWVIIYLLLPLQSKPKLDTNLSVPDYQTNQKSIEFKSIYEKINYKGESNYILNKALNIGVPMGLGYSPLLAMLLLCKVLREWKLNHNNFVTYADDGILMTHCSADIDRFNTLCSKYGLAVNLEKSQFIKTPDITIENYKFLGLIHKIKNDTICSKTRKGSQNTYNFHTIKEEFIQWNYGTLFKKIHNWLDDFEIIWPPKLHQKYIDPRIQINFRNYLNKFSLTTIYKKLTNIPFTYQEAIRNNIFSTILSRLYKPPQLIIQNFNLTYKKGSLCSQILKSGDIKRRAFHQSAILNNIKWSGAEYEHYLEVCEIYFNLNVFNHSTQATNLLVQTVKDRTEYLLNHRNQFSISNLLELYEKKWKEKSEQIEWEKTNTGRIIATKEGKITETQIGTLNFEMLLEKGYKVEQSI